MASKSYVPIPVDGPLDTANPPTSLKPGDLVEAVDVAHQYLGPRGGLTQQTWPYQSSASFPNRKIPVFDGNNSYALGSSTAKNQGNLGTQWCLDLVIRPSGVSHSADTSLDIFNWELTGSTTFSAIKVAIGGGGAPAGDQRKITATVKLTSSPSIVGSTKVLSGTSQLSVGTALSNTHHIRVYRDVTTLYLQINGTTEASYTAIDTYRSENSTNPSDAVIYYLAKTTGTATGGNHFYAGRILSCVLRSGAASLPGKGMADFTYPFDPAVRFALYGANGGDSTYSYEKSCYHGSIEWFNTTFENLSQPAPWSSNPVQGGTHFVDRRGRTWNAVMSGGTLFWKRVF